MRNLWWIALVAVAGGTARAEDANGQPGALAPYGALLPGQAAAPAPSVPAAPLMADGANPSCGNGCSSCNSCSGCGTGNAKIKRFCEWLVYVPLDHGKTKCCRHCDSCAPPAWVFFPCEGGGRCSWGTAPAAPATVYYAKEAGATTTNRIVETAYPPKTAESKPLDPPGRVSTYKPQVVKDAMPVLDPGQFRKAPPANACTK